MSFRPFPFVISWVNLSDRAGFPQFQDGCGANCGSFFYFINNLRGIKSFQTVLPHYGKTSGITVGRSTVPEFLNVLKVNSQLKTKQKGRHEAAVMTGVNHFTHSYKPYIRTIQNLFKSNLSELKYRLFSKEFNRKYTKAAHTGSYSVACRAATVYSQKFHSHDSESPDQTLQQK